MTADEGVLLTAWAIRVTQYAGEEARRFPGGAVGAEHLLLGLLREEDGLARPVLERLGINLLYARSELLRLAHQAGASAQAQGSRGWSPEARRILEAAASAAHEFNAKQGKGDFVDTEHILFSLVSERPNAAIPILLACGVDPEEVRAKILRLFERRARVKPKAGQHRKPPDK
jgi:ATP-dependent Clp protease ATP-binding subunit ClpC